MPTSLMQNQPAKLTVCLPVNYLGVGGAERQLTELAVGLDKSSFEVVVVTLQSGGPLESELVGQEGVSLYSLERKGKLDARPALRLAGILRRHDVHLVQPFLTPATLYGLAAALLAKTPIRIVTERNGLRLNAGLGNNIYRFVEDRMTRFADCVVPNSEAGRRYVASRGIKPKEVRVIYNGINPVRLQPDPVRVRAIRQAARVPRDGVLVGNVASLTVAKDQAMLLRAVASVMLRHAEVRLALVGDGPLRPQLEALANDLGIHNKVTFFGNQQTIADYIGAMDIAALSSADHEGCSNFLLEAMGNGKPVVTTDIGGNPELVEPGRSGIIVPAANSGAMAHALCDLLEVRERREAMGERGRHVVRNRFSLQRMIREYEDLFRSLATRKLGRLRKPTGAAA